MRLGSASGVTHPPASLLGLSTQMSPRGGSLPGSCVPLSWGWGCAGREQVPALTSSHAGGTSPAPAVSSGVGSQCRCVPLAPRSSRGGMGAVSPLTPPASAPSPRSCWATCAAGDSIVALSSSGDAANGLRAEASASGHRFAAPSMRGTCHMHRFLSDTRDSLWPWHHPERPQRGHLCLWSWGQKEGALKWEEEEKAA